MLLAMTYIAHYVIVGVFGDSGSSNFSVQEKHPGAERTYIPWLDENVPVGNLYCAHWKCIPNMEPKS